MSRNSDLFSLPASPADLCFDKNEFMKKTFSVDDFLHKNRNAASLEIIRDDLGIYLKVLRSAMIELINQDYADFVDLSANLIGLDQQINGISSPLEKLKEEILNVKQCLSDNMTEISNCLEQKKELRTFKKSLESLAKVQRSLEKLQNLLESDVNPTILERAALESIQLQFNMKFCDTFLDEGQKRSSQNLRENLLEKIKEYFLDTLTNKNLEGLERSLRIFCTLDECRKVEDILRTNIIAPAMYKIISESNLQNSPQGLTGIYNQILDFVSINLKDLVTMTKKNGKVKGFNFILNSFWVEIERRIETNMSSIFAPGNPESFYQKYKCTLEFLERIELIIDDADDVLALKDHPQYKSFQVRWNLPVYFQIRFQEIGAILEGSCAKKVEIGEKVLSNQFNLSQFKSCLICISKCWQDGIYLPQLFHRFFKLTLQIMARIAKWTNEAAQETNEVKLNVCLYTDTVLLIQKISQILSIIVEKSPILMNKEIPAIEKCFDDSKVQLKANLDNLQSILVKGLTVNSAMNVRQVNDIPRLFRKTNRDVPSKCCPYVEQIMEPSKKFYDEFKEAIEEVQMKGFLVKIFSNVTVQYYHAVDEVLTSVQKTEESLRRLKNLRDRTTTLKTSASAPMLAGQERTVTSDDDKIRLQLQVDVIYYTNDIEKFHIERGEIDKLPELIQLVEEATKIKITNN